MTDGDSGAYTYDNNFNRLNNGATSIGPGNRLKTQVDSHGTTWTLTYDGEGNLKTKYNFDISSNDYPHAAGQALVNYSHDLRNRLTKVTTTIDQGGQGDGTIHNTRVIYRYDAQDQRAQKDVEADDETPVVEKYTNDGPNLLLVNARTSRR